MDDYRREESFLQERFEKSRTIPGTRKLHCFVPVSRSKVSTRAYSSSPTAKEERVTIQENQLELDEIHGFVTCLHQQKWWVGCVLQVYEDSGEVFVRFLHPHGPSSSFRYPRRDDNVSIHFENVLTKVDPLTTTGKCYTLTKQ